MFVWSAAGFIQSGKRFAKSEYPRFGGAHRIDECDCQPRNGKTVDVAGITDDERAKAAIAAWSASGMTGADLQRLRGDIDAYTKTGQMAADTFNTRYAAFFEAGFQIEDADLRRNLARLWKQLPAA